MTKQGIVNVVSEATGLTKVETEAVMNGVMTTIINALTENQRVELRGKRDIPREQKIVVDVIPRSLGGST